MLSDQAKQLHLALWKQRRWWSEYELSFIDDLPGAAKELRGQIAGTQVELEIEETTNQTRYRYVTHRREPDAVDQLEMFG